MSEDIVARLRSRADETTGPGNFAAWIDFASNDLADAADEIERLRANLTEALRLMESVAEAVKAQDDDRLPDTCTVLQRVGPLRAIADFVKRMRGAPNE